MLAMVMVSMSVPMGTLEVGDGLRLVRESILAAVKNPKCLKLYSDWYLFSIPYAFDRIAFSI